MVINIILTGLDDSALYMGVHASRKAILKRLNVITNILMNELIFFYSRYGYKLASFQLSILDVIASHMADGIAGNIVNWWQSVENSPM